jgi:hypothetical protein
MPDDPVDEEVVEEPKPTGPGPADAVVVVSKMRGET